MEEIYKELIQGSGIAHAYYKIICDSNDIPYDYKCIEVNKAFEKHADLRAEDLIGKGINNILPDDLESERDWIERYGRIAINGEKAEYEKYSKTTDRWYKIQVFSPKKYFFVVNCIDITELKTLSRKLRESQRTLWQVMDTIPSIVFWKDKNFKYLGCNKKFSEYAGRSIDEMIGKDDYEMGWKSLADLYRKDDKHVMETGQSKLNFEEKIITSRGKVKWIKTSKIPLYDNDNNIYGLLGNFEDITKQKEVEEALRNSKLRYEQLAEKSHSVAWEADRNGLYTYISPVAEKVFGYKPDEIVGKMYVYDSFQQDEKYKEFILSIIDKKESVSDLENKLKNKNNEDIWISTNGFPVLDDKGQLLFYRGVDIDISYLKKAEEKIKFLSFRDQLTGLYNRRFFEEELKRLDTERNLPISLIMVDINGLKLVNDTFGHNAGDLLLKKTANILKQGCRSDDIVARIGGDEFIILLPKTNPEEAKIIIDRINIEIKKAKVEAVNLSISYGIDTKKEIYENMDDIFKRADIKMYNHKNRERAKLRREIIETILQRLFEKSSEEKAHSKGVSEISAAIGKALNLNDLEIEKLKAIGKFHDIGKIAITKQMLSAKGKLNQEYWREIKRHSELGYIILSSSNEHISFAEDVLYHHERYDGKGYPKGLKGERIPLNSRIIALADAYDTMVNHRAYRQAMSSDKAVGIILKESGKQFDPKIVKVFLDSNLVEEYKNR